MIYARDKEKKALSWDKLIGEQARKEFDEIMDSDFINNRQKKNM